MSFSKNGWGSVKLLAAVIISMALVGCGNVAVPTPYQPHSAPTGGYTDKQIADDVYRVVFAGSVATPLPTSYAYAIYRAAEIARDHDAPYFEVVEGFMDRKPEDDGPNFSRIEPQDLPARALAERGRRVPLELDPSHVVYVSEADFGAGWSVQKTVYVVVPMIVPSPQWYTASLLIRLLKEKPADKDKAYHVFETARILSILGPRLKRPKPEAPEAARS